jgi:hypothetical protein
MPNPPDYVLSLFYCDNLPLGGLLCLQDVWDQMLRCARIKGLIKSKISLEFNRTCQIFWKLIPKTKEEPLKLLFGLTKKRISELEDNDNIYLWQIQYQQQ